MPTSGSGDTRDGAAAARRNWMDGLGGRVEFTARGGLRARRDGDFDWRWYAALGARDWRGRGRRVLSRLLRRLRLRRPPHASRDWLEAHAAELWEVRGLLADDLSRLLFDDLLVLRCSGSDQFAYPRVDYHDFAVVAADVPFADAELPGDYLGLPLRVFDLELAVPAAFRPLRVISTRLQVELLNRFRQYLVTREGRDYAPAPGEVVLDCGACIGEVSTILAALVGPRGEVHLFDPVPLHARFCARQAALNPALAPVLRVNVLAVGARSAPAGAGRADAAAISPGGLSIEAYATTTLDEYGAAQGLRRVDFIKMDIEGAEREALAGAAGIIGAWRPRLAISAYHRPDDLWELPRLMLALNPGYRLHFGHHSPITWESVFYAR